MKVAITGNIGSGKTEVIKFLIGLKFKCISSDKIIADLYKDNSIKKTILHKLNIPDDNFKKKIIEKLLDTSFDRKLKKVIYPYLYAKRKTIAPKHQSLMPIFYEVPLLFEEKLSKNFDLTIFIKADTLKRKKRVLARGVKDDYFDLMNRKQLNQDQKELSADHTLINNSSVLNLRLNVIKLLSKI